MYTAYRLNDPNEIMPPHRHSPNAIRLGLTGAMNFTVQFLNLRVAASKGQSPGLAQFGPFNHGRWT